MPSLYLCLHTGNRHGRGRSVCVCMWVSHLFSHRIPANLICEGHPDGRTSVLALIRLGWSRIWDVRRKPVSVHLSWVSIAIRHKRKAVGDLVWWPVGISRPPTLPIQPNNRVQKMTAHPESHCQTPGGWHHLQHAGQRNRTQSAEQSVSQSYKRGLSVCFIWLTFEPQNTFLFALRHFKQQNL